MANAFDDRVNDTVASTMARFEYDLYRQSTSDAGDSLRIHRLRNEYGERFGFGVDEFGTRERIVERV